MPKMRDPATVGAPRSGTAGSETSTPLLSWGKRKTGFWIWLPSATEAGVQPAAPQVKYTDGIRVTRVQAEPQSSRNTPMPRSPRAPRADTVSAAVPPLLQSEGGAGTSGEAMSWMGTAEACSPAMRTSAVATAPQP